MLNHGDAYHDWVNFQMPGIQPPLLTCEAVITEACFLSRRHVGGANAIINMVHNGFMTVSFQLNKEIDLIKNLMAKYANIPMSFADACLVRISEQHPHSAILTLDSDFRVVLQW